MRFLALAGLVIAGYLSYTHLTDAHVACGGSSGCDAVKNSVYSEVAGIPVAVFGVVIYLSLLALQLTYDHADAAWTDNIPLLIFGIGLAGILYSAYLTYLELFVIHAICRWCVASAVVITAYFVLSIFDLREYAATQ